MAIRNKLRLSRGKRSPTGNADRLAPPEEKHGELGAGPIDGPKVKISADLMDESDHGSILKMDPIVIAILLGAVAFIVFIAWKIHEMPAP
jgi:hypothetical protein